MAGTYLGRYQDNIEYLLAPFSIPNDFRQALAQFMRATAKATLFGADIGDANLVMRGSQNTVSGPTPTGVYCNTARTATRTVSLPPTTESIDGDYVRVVQTTTAANGSFQLAVALPGGATLKTFASNAAQAGAFEYSSTLGTWIEVDFASL